ncbi:hypothetical protein L596_027179 [Steinernema carpocapsae]|uniref:Uncharacterized protein n=1 Tax=Steinernema carpocapsae TaxID=34508 RepID=A0A4U5M3K3_STECR|nr:hypothetical protein L596_027179 [Steinernema carpocapsae]
MNSILYAILLLAFVLSVSAELFPSEEFTLEQPWSREYLRAYRVRRDWSDPVAQATGWSIYPGSASWAFQG